MEVEVAGVCGCGQDVWEGPEEEPSPSANSAMDEKGI